MNEFQEQGANEKFKLSFCLYFFQQFKILMTIGQYTRYMDRVLKCSVESRYNELNVFANNLENNFFLQVMSTPEIQCQIFQPFVTTSVKIQ
jgi:hypothetical protein